MKRTKTIYYVNLTFTSVTVNADDDQDIVDDNVYEEESVFESESPDAASERFRMLFDSLQSKEVI